MLACLRLETVKMALSRVYGKRYFCIYNKRMRFGSLLIISLSLSLFAIAQQDGPSTAPSKEDQSESSARATEMSSSKDTRVDLSPPANDQKEHPNSGMAVSDMEEAASDVQELHPWDPHKAAKDIEVGDFYFKKKNYRAALERYKDALVYKPNDALAQYRLAECLDKTGNASEAITHYQEYLKILPHGPFAADAQKALDRLKASAVKEPS
jgi:tetratricopeptide (TPR) repeat protein